MLSFSICVLAEFAYCLSAEHVLARAARAGALEATLPRATYRSVADAVQRRLSGHTALAEQLRIVVLQNGGRVGSTLRTASGDRIAVNLAVPVHGVLPHWLNAFNLWTGESQIEVRAEREVPGRALGRDQESSSPATMVRAGI